MKRATLLMLIVGCTVPDLDALGKKHCDLDAGHPCVDGYVCVVTFCEPANGGPCTGAQTQPCGNGKGECRMGVMTCAGGMFGPCEGGVGPTDEICDGKDNDCDGFTDENLFDTRPCEKNVGVCAGAHHGCVGGQFEATCGAASYGADYQTVESLCDDKDNDCNGQVDEAGAGACADAGVCAGALLTCTNGTPGACAAAGYQVNETTCDGLDNDCDGLVDEGIVSSTSCGKPLGVCAGKNAACVDGGFESVCTAASFGPSYEPVETRCDGVDNDCDGVVDRGAGGALLRSSVLCELQAGVCAGATRACVDGGFETPCGAASYGPAYVPIDAVCDGMDHDCDGVPNRTVNRLLVGGQGAQSHLAWAWTAPHLGIAYQDDATGASRIFYKAGLDAAPTLLSDPSTSATSPALAAGPTGQFTAAWADVPPGDAGRVLAAGLTLDGTVSWTRVMADHVNVFAGPRIAALDGTSAVVVWVDADSSTVQATILTPDGLSAPPKLLSSGKPSDGGAGEQVIAADIAVRNSGYFVAWSALEGGSSYARFRQLNPLLAMPGSVAQVTNSGEVVTEIRVSPASAAWVGSGAVSTVRYQFSDGGTLAFVSTASALGGLAVIDGAAFWLDGATHLKGRFEDGGVVDYSPGSASVSGTAALGLSNTVVVGYETDPGTGNGLDIDYQSICPP